MTKRKSFSPEFKREAVRLLETSQKSSADLGRNSSGAINSISGKNS